MLRTALRAPLKHNSKLWKCHFHKQEEEEEEEEEEKKEEEEEKSKTVGGNGESREILRARLSQVKNRRDCIEDKDGGGEKQGGRERGQPTNCLKF